MRIYDFLIQSSIVSIALIAVIYLVRKVIKNKVSPSVLYYLWIILIIRMLMPYTIGSSLSINRFINDVKQIQIDNNIYITYDGSEFHDIRKSVGGIGDTKVELKDYEVIDKVKDLLFFMWLIGVVGISSYGLISYIIVNKKIGREKIIEGEEYNDILTQCLDKLNLRRRVRIVETSLVSSPAIYRVFFPMILMPKGFRDSMDIKDIKYIFMHELTHVKRGDLIINLFTHIVRALYWFNPLMHMALNRMKIDCELACDYHVLKYLDKDENINYGNTLINIVKNLSNGKKILGSTPMVTKREDIKDRINKVVNFKRAKGRYVILGLVCILVVGLIGLTGKMKVEAVNINDKEINEIKSTINGYIDALNSGDEKGKREYTIKDFLTVNKENDLFETMFNDTGKVLDISIDEVISEKEVVAYVKCENYTGIFGVYKEKGRWLVESSGFSPRKTDGDKYSYSNINNDLMTASSRLEKFLEEKGYTPIANSGIAASIKLPNTFNDIRRDVNIGEIMERYNELSKKEGYDFSKYLGEKVSFVNIVLQEEEKNAMIMVKDGKVLALAIMPKEDEVIRDKIFLLSAVSQ